MKKIVVRKILITTWAVLITGVFIYLMVTSINRLVAVNDTFIKLNDPLHALGMLKITQPQLYMQIVNGTNKNLADLIIMLFFEISVYSSFAILVTPKIIRCFKPLIIENRINPPTL